ncbi:hypothetical protein Pint_29184 [Pistacia integerrima]|uniref:Uncharacterized protein n=1 Tax=Pistacia integerrima TaxID=434235 RepID=A0ACC0WZD1_9ROSI|nr:hypothetical protein Pint_29184 [Pistacia integerrima]
MFMKLCSLVLLLSSFFYLGIVEASVHEYEGEKFVSKGNAFVVHGGSEGIYSSVSDDTSNEKANNGDAYIREKSFTGLPQMTPVGLKCLVSHFKFGRRGENDMEESYWLFAWQNGTTNEFLWNCITLVITLGMFEMALWYFEYAEFNETGVRPTGDHCGLTSKVIMLGVTFFLASEVLELVENVGAVSDLSGKARLFLVLPVAILDAFFILWIFTSLSATLNKLQARRMMVKLDIYRKFTNALAVTVIVSVGWICYELYFKSKDVYNEHWQNAWIVPAFWQVLSFSLLCVICVLWAPSQNSMRYAYTEDSNEDFEKDETNLTLIKPSLTPLKDVRSAPEPRMVQSDNGTLNSDLEEDKTE